MKKFFKCLMFCISCFVFILGINLSSAMPAPNDQWESIVVVDEPTDQTLLSTVTASTFSFQLWHYSGGYWGNEALGIHIPDNKNGEIIDDPKELADKLNQKVPFSMELPQAVKEAVDRGSKIKVVCQAPSNMKLSEMFDFNVAGKENPKFRIANGKLYFEAYPKLNVAKEKYQEFVPGLKKMIPIAMPPYGKNVYSIFTTRGTHLGMATGYFNPNNPQNVGPEGTIHPKQIADVQGHLERGFKVKVIKSGVTTMHDSDGIAVGDHTFQNAGAVGLQFDYPVVLKFYIAENDLSARFETIPGSVPTGENVLIGVRVNSTFKTEVNTEYAWNVVKENGEPVSNISYLEPYPSASGRAQIPVLGEQIFYVQFPMPDSKVNVTFRINNVNGSDPKEIVLVNNVANSVIKDNGQVYMLDYDVLTRKINHQLMNGEEILAQLVLPRGYWSSNATGLLNVEKKDYSPEVLQSFVVTNNPPVNEWNSRIVRKPIAKATIDRSSFGDNPLAKIWRNLSEPWSPLTKNPSIDFYGSVKRNYEYYCGSENCSGHTGTTTASFEQGPDVVAVKVYSYNGKRPSDMPYVAARNFKEEIEQNYQDKPKRNLFWISYPYPLEVIRWMGHVNESGTKGNWRQVDGQYDRTFTQQNTADITFEVDESMAEWYQDDRQNAKLGRNGKNYYLRVPFATEKQFRNVDYPFKSGYYFNPAGTYKFTIKTVLYKDNKNTVTQNFYNNTINRTAEHGALVKKVIDSFRYDSDLEYIDNARNRYYVKLKAGNPLLKIDIRKIKQDFFELPHSTSTNGSNHRFFKEILEGYVDSNTQSSKDKYLYREYIKDGQHIYEITEETEVIISVNPNNQKLYTRAQMKDGQYRVRAWIENFDSGFPNLPDVVGKGLDRPLDAITVSVKGSMFDDLNN